MSIGGKLINQRSFSRHRASTVAFSSATAPMPINSRWPDFQFASKLRLFVGSQSNEPQVISTDKSSSLLGGGSPKREQKYIDDSQDPGLDEHIATMSEMEEQDYDNLSHDEAGVEADDADFGDLEMFDSNASPVIYSQVSQLLRSEETSIPETESASKRDKKKKKKKEKAIAAAAEEAEPETTSKKRKRSKKSSHRESEDGDGRSPNVEEPVSSSLMPLAEDLAKIEGAVSDMHVNELSTQKPKKRKMSDSASDKPKKKKHRNQVPEDIIEATQEEEDLNMEPDSREGHATFLRTRTTNLVDSDSLSAIDNDDPDSQLSPSLARARRRSNSTGLQSIENGDSFRAAVAPMAPMVDMDDANLAPSLQSKADADVEELAREAWREHISTQIENGEDISSRNEADGNAASEEPIHEEAVDEKPRNRRSARGKQLRTNHDAPDEAAAVESSTAVDIVAPEETPRRKSRGKIAVKSSKGRPPPKEGASSATKPKTPKSKARISDDEGEAETPAQDTVNGYVQGRFSDAELARLKRAVENFRDELGLTQEQINAMIHAPGGTSAGSEHAELWLRLTAECPDRKRQKVINVTRKKFHNFVARGTWTPEQDAELALLIKANGTAWSKIANMINRHPEDIRDRYRNYLVCGAAQKKDVWDTEEEARLIQHIQDAIVIIDDIRVHDDNPDMKHKSYEELIDWQSISEKMDRTRSRLQCITKWKLINKRFGNPPNIQLEFNAQQELQAIAKLETTRQSLLALGDAEHYRLVLAIDQATAPAAKKVSWGKMTDQGLSSQWTRASQLLFWHRLKQFVPESSRKSVKEITQYIINLYNQEGSMPDLQQVQNDEQEVKVLKSVRVSTAPISQPKSAEIVENSGAEDEAPSNLPGGQMDDIGMNIDPALSQDSPPVQKPASSRKRTPAKHRSKKALIEDEDLIEDVETIVAEVQNVDVGEEVVNTEGTAERQKKRTKKTPSKPKSMDSAKDAVQDSENMAPVRMSSDSEMDDMEDLPARITSSTVKAH